MIIHMLSNCSGEGNIAVVLSIKIAGRIAETNEYRQDITI